MRKLIAALTLFCWSLSLAIYADIVVITNKDKIPKFVLDTSTGRTTPVDGVYIEGNESSTPIPPVDPGNGGTPTDPIPPNPNDAVRASIGIAARSVGEVDTAKALAGLYSQAAQRITNGTSLNDARGYVDFAFDFVVINQNGTGSKWTAFKKNVDDLSTQLRQQGVIKSDADWAKFFASVSAGLDDSAPGAKLDLDKLLELLMKLFDLYLKFKSGGLF